MIAKPKMYDEIEVNQEFTPISLGGHKGIIMSAEEYTSPISGNMSLRVCVDTDKDDLQPNYFTDLYKNDTREDKKWSNSAIKYVSLKEDESCVRMLKSFITAAENSNDGYTFNWDKDWEQLKGKKVGLNFGLEEYQDQEGEVRTATKLVQFRSLDKLNEIKIPKVKLLDGTTIDYELYKNRPQNSAKNDTVVIVNPDELPF